MPTRGWGAAASDLADPDLNGGRGARPGQPLTINNGDLGSQDRYFEFTITPTLNQIGSDRVGLRVDGIDFYDREEVGGGNLWTVRYDLDDFLTVIASGVTHGGTFTHNRVEFDYPAGFSRNLPGDVPITFRLSGPKIPFREFANQPVPWHVDNLSLYGGNYTIRDTSIIRPPTRGIPQTIDSRTIVRTSPTTGTTTVTRQKQRAQAAGVGLPRGLAFNGFASDGQVFFDSNGNGIADFLDIDGNGSQDAGEPNEPLTLTDAGGLFEILIGPEFDQSDDGLVDPNDGLLVLHGGFDQGTEVELELRFKSPAGSSTISPLTTVVSSLLTRQVLTVEQAHDLVRDGIVVAGQNIRGDADLFFDDSAERINEGDANAIAEYLAVLETHNTTILFAKALENSSTSIADAGEHVFDAIADELTQQTTLDLTDQAAVRRILDSSANAAASTLSDDLKQAIVTVAANANLAIEAIASTADFDYLRALKKLQRVIMTQTADAIAQAVDGNITTTDLLDQNSVASLAVRAASERVGTIFPVSVTIDDVAAGEPTSGSVDFEFTFTLLSPSGLAVSVDFHTVSTTASSAEGDFTDVAGTIEFAPGETEKTISVPVLADSVDEVGEVFHVQLSNPRHALIETVRGVGFIRIPADATVLPSEFVLGGNTSVLVGESVDLFAALPDIIDATIDWGDGTVEAMALADEGDRIRAEATHNYATDGVFNVVATFNTAAGTVTGRETVIVSKPSFSVDIVNGQATLSVESGLLIVRSDGQELFNQPVVDVGTLSLVGTANDESLTIVANNQFSLPSGGVRLIGDAGINTIVVVGGGATLDFTDPRIDATDFASLDLSSNDVNSVRLNAAIISKLSPVTNQVVIRGGLEDQISLSDVDSWRLTDPLVVNDTFLRTAGILGGDQTLQVDLPHPWQNFLRRGDVDNNGRVTALDALVIINELARRSFSDDITQLLRDPRLVQSWPGFYYDTSGEGMATARDALIVINDLARRGTASSVGEAEPVLANPLHIPIDENRSVDWFDPGLPVQSESVMVDAFSSSPLDGFGQPIESAIQSQRQSSTDQSNSAAVDHLLTDDQFLEDIGVLSATDS